MLVRAMNEADKIRPGNVEGFTRKSHDQIVIGS